MSIWSVPRKARWTTAWLAWFLSVLEEALAQALNRIERVLIKARFWQRHAQTVLSERQVKVLSRLLDHSGEEFVHGINASKYKSLAKVSKATATRDLADLVEKDCLERLPGGCIVLDTHWSRPSS